MKRDTIFISYSRADSSGRNALVKHLEVVLGKPPRVRIFADTSIETGEEWRNRIHDEMDRALVVVLLVSADFLTSSFVQSVEIPRAVLAARRGEAVIACLYVRHCAADAFHIHVDDPNGEGFDIHVTDYQGLNTPNSPLMARKGAKREQLLAQTAGEIVKLAEERLKEATNDGRVMLAAPDVTDAGPAVEAKRKAEEETRQQEAEAKRRAEEERRQQEAEAKRKAEEETRQQEAEAKRKAEEKRRQREAEAKRKAEEKRRQREAKAKRKAEALQLKHVPSEDKVHKSQEEVQPERHEKSLNHWKRLRWTLVLGVPLLALIIITASVIIPNVLDRRRTSEVMRRAKRLALFMEIYSADHDRQLPPADNWSASIASNSPTSDVESIVTSPFDPPAGRAWAMNSGLQTIPARGGASQFVLLFEARLGSPPAGGPELLPVEPREQRGYVIIFANYLVEFVPPDQVNELVWHR
jgi:hypothetical protein